MASTSSPCQGRYRPLIVLDYLGNDALGLVIGGVHVGDEPDGGASGWLPGRQAVR